MASMLGLGGIPQIVSQTASQQGTTGGSGIGGILLQLLPMLISGGLGAAFGGAGGAGSALSSFAQTKLALDELEERRKQQRVAAALEAWKQQQRDKQAEAGRETQMKIAEMRETGAERRQERGAELQKEQTRFRIDQESQPVQLPNISAIIEDIKQGKSPTVARKDVGSVVSALASMTRQQEQQKFAEQQQQRAQEFSKQQQASQQQFQSVQNDLSRQAADRRAQLYVSRATDRGAQSKIEAAVRGFDLHPITKTFNEVQNKFHGVQAILDKGVGGPADLAIVYEFMKGIDPDSVVRESERDAAIASGNIFAGAWARFNGFFRPEGGFLPEAVKREFGKLVGLKLDTITKQYENLRREYGKRVERFTGQTGGMDYLTDYGAAFGTSDKKSPDAEADEYLRKKGLIR